MFKSAKIRKIRGNSVLRQLTFSANPSAASMNKREFVRSLSATSLGLMFGPVRWFAMLMATLLLASYLPERVLDRVAARLASRGL